MATSRLLQPLRLGRPLLPCGPLCRRVSSFTAGRPFPARPRVVPGAGVRPSSPLLLPTAAPMVAPEPAHAAGFGARAFSCAGPVYRSKSSPTYRWKPRQVDRCRVVFSWIPPGRPVKLLFKEAGAAREAHDAYSSETAKVLGKPVAATKPKHGVKPFGWMMRVYGLPDTARQEDIVAGLDPARRPHHVEVGPKMPMADVDRMVDDLRERAEAFGPIHEWQHHPLTGRRAKISATFEYPSSAEEAVKALAGQRVEFRDGTHALLSIKTNINIQLRIPAKQYKATQKMIEEIQPPWEEKFVNFFSRPSADGDITVTISGTACYEEALRGAEAAVKKILEGHLAVSEDGKPLWHPSFDRNWRGFDEVKILENQVPVYIVRSRKKKQLRVSGPEYECRLAMKRIEALIRMTGPDEDYPSRDTATLFY